MSASFGNTLEELRHRVERLHAERYNAQLIPTPEWEKLMKKSTEKSMKRWKKNIARGIPGVVEAERVPSRYPPMTEDYKERMRRLTADVVLTLGVVSTSEPTWCREQLYSAGSTGFADTRFYRYDLGGGYALRVSWQNFRLDATNSIQVELVGEVKVKRSYAKKSLLLIKQIVEYEDVERLESEPIIVQDNEKRDEWSLAHFPPEEREKLRSTILAMYWALHRRFG